MRFITIPEDILIVNPITGKPMQILDEDAQQPSVDQLRSGAQQVLKDDLEKKKFKDWVKTFVLQDEKFNKKWEVWQRVTRITEALADAHPGDVIPLDEEDWELASDVAKEPSRPMYPSGLIAAQYSPFIMAIAGTKDNPIPSKKPSKKAKK